MSHLIAISTSPGTYPVSKNEMKSFIEKRFSDPVLIRKYNALLRDESIRTKHSVLPDFLTENNNPVLFNPDLPEPGTAERMKVFEKEAPAISAIVCKDVLTKSRIAYSDITHIVTISCTGMAAPGLEIELIQELGLSASVQRYSVNFMGCYAAFHGFKLADMICKTNDKANVLMVCTELCSLHFRLDESDDNLLSNYLFSDGASACIITAKKPVSGAYLKAEIFDSQLISDGKNDMGWYIGNNGFEMILSKEVPGHIEAQMEDCFNRIIKKKHLTKSDISYFAIHPGGKNILKAFESGLKIDQKQLQESYEILRDYGNMSSATILFVLNKILSEKDSEKGWIYSAAFGPGLTIESGLFYLE